MNSPAGEQDPQSDRCFGETFLWGPQSSGSSRREAAIGRRDIIVRANKCGHYYVVFFKASTSVVKSMNIFLVINMWCTMWY